jgi:hypothetical protein
MDRGNLVTIYAIDPGSEQSALVVYDTDRPDDPIRSHCILPNDDIMNILRTSAPREADAVLAIEEFVTSFGMAVGREVFATVWWSGRFYQAWHFRAVMIPRKTAVTAICGVARANDSHVRQEILDRFGGKIRAIGKKKTPGPLYGLKGHEFAALAIALTKHQQIKEAANVEKASTPEAQTLPSERAV